MSYNVFHAVLLGALIVIGVLLLLTRNEVDNNRSVSSHNTDLIEEIRQACTVSE